MFGVKSEDKMATEARTTYGASDETTAMYPVLSSSTATASGPADTDTAAAAEESLAAAVGSAAAAAAADAPSAPPLNPEAQPLVAEAHPAAAAVVASEPGQPHQSGPGYQHAGGMMMQPNVLEPEWQHSIAGCMDHGCSICLYSVEFANDRLTENSQSLSVCMSHC